MAQENRTNSRASRHNQPPNGLRKSSVLRKVGFGAAMAAGITGGLLAGSTLRSAISGHSATPAAAVPRLPGGKPNFNPVISVDNGEQYDVELDPTRSASTYIGYPEYVGYAQETDGPGGVKLMVGAQIIPGKDGGVEVNPLYGPRHLRLTQQQLKHGPSTIPLGGDYSLQIGLEPGAGGPEVFFGPEGQQPEPGTFVRQP